MDLPWSHRARLARATTACARRGWRIVDTGRAEVLLVATGERFDVWRVPKPVAHRALELLDAVGVPVGPVAETPDGDLQFYSQPCSAEPMVADTPIVHLGKGGHVLLPPSRVREGELHWWRAPSGAALGLPPWRPLVQSLRAASGAGPARVVIPGALPLAG